MTRVTMRDDAESMVAGNVLHRDACGTVRHSLESFWWRWKVWCLVTR